MIFVHDKGRMANNMLQYGHVYAWGREHGRKTMSMRFAYKYQWFHICDTPYHNFATYVLAKYAARWGLIPAVGFNDKHADSHDAEELMRSRRFIVVSGWYARWYDLFLKYKDEILRLFAFKDSVRQRPDALLAAQPTADIRLGLHIRRGDYKTWYGGRFYYNDEQYIGVVRQFLKLHTGKQVQLYICGNDPRLDRQAFRQALPDVQVVFPDGNAAEDLYLLSRCDFLMGPPSTFTLVASMYHDVPLYWIKDAEAPVTADNFDKFDNLFQHIL
ncbi:MAG: glycosyltransferase [Prevotella sp.]|nr:glycosyltransferase [Prevotella sp.]